MRGSRDEVSSTVQPIKPLLPASRELAGFFSVSTIEFQPKEGPISVLVTGGAGYIGGHMVLALTDAAKDVVVVDDLSTGFSWGLPPTVAFYEGNCGDEGLIAKIVRTHDVQAIVHFAGSIVVPDSVSGMDPAGGSGRTAIACPELLRCRSGARHKAVRSSYRAQPERLARRSRGSVARFFRECKFTPMRE